ncbi:FKBP type peptidylprolyl isomerase [Emiliania huxleyi CCMP1516]|uniref:peptidylprolyl isomerase n=2 Tax=Emiliania huxleyi TaxID=2903 RepID=A0A0D3KPJ2_EMIH1|nr:FKBP type peptidylprolyl isomerase [Emiliania huxleyi CCMP1516]EOD37677.1 FKBP type peptidylprolyl isomerase [Emiliania huxleyi CCMP1516]|eukprot:XP_005790106.1 FKBP type peptidylprolyl isomerase [Emiliania huxleyi CCMP1516]
MLLACSLLASGAAAAVTELKVEVYDGPKECEDADKLKKGEHVSMHYTGTIDKDSAAGTPGKQFDSSRGRGKTFDFQLGAGRVIQGWDKGLEGLCVGAKAVLTIPPDMGYGARGAGGDIPGGAALSFDVEVVSHSDEGPPEPNLFKDLDTDKDAKLTKEEVLAFFKQQGKEELPEGLWEKEDKDKDGFISWEEFGGPKGKSKDEL